MRSAHALIETFTTAAASDNVTYVVSADLHILRTNPAWERFGRANGGDDFLGQWQHGASLLDVIPPPLRVFFHDGFARAAASGERWEHDYECSSPALFRLYRMIAYPFAEAFVVTHALLVERAHDREPHAPDDAYVARGVLVMCAHCRRVRHGGERERWDWVPGYVADMPPNVSHGLCPPCARYYYGV